MSGAWTFVQSTPIPGVELLGELTGEPKTINPGTVQVDGKITHIRVEIVDEADGVAILSFLRDRRVPREGG